MKYSSVKPLWPENNDFGKPPFQLWPWVVIMGILALSLFLFDSQTESKANSLSFYKVSCGPLGSYQTLTEPIIDGNYLRFTSVEQNSYMVARDRCIVRIPNE